MEEGSPWQRWTCIYVWTIGVLFLYMYARARARVCVSDRISVNNWLRQIIALLLQYNLIDTHGRVRTNLTRLPSFYYTFLIE